MPQKKDSFIEDDSFVEDALAEHNVVSTGQQLADERARRVKQLRKVESPFQSLTIGVPPTELVQRLVGVGKGYLQVPAEIASTVSKGIAPGVFPSIEQLPESSYLKPQNEAQATGNQIADIGMTLEGIRGIKNIVKEQPLVSRVKQLRAEMSLAPKGGEATALAAKYATEGGDPISGIFQFSRDRRVMQKMKDATDQLDAAEKAIPATTTIPKQKILTALSEGIDDLNTPGLGSRFRRTLGDRYNELAKLQTEQIPYERARRLRQDLDKMIEDSSGWSETASTADRTELSTLRRVAGTVRDELRGLSPAMDTANDAYHEASQLARVVRARRKELAGLTIEQQVQRAGMPPPNFVRRTLPYGVGTGILGAGSAYELMRYLHGLNPER